MNLDRLREIGASHARSADYKKFTAIYDKSPKRSGRFLRMSSLFDLIKPYTDYVDGQRGFPFKTIELFALRYPQVRPVCRECGAETKWQGNRFSWYCSLRCSNSSAKVKAKKAATSRKRWGTNNPNQNAKVREKIRLTNEVRYGGSSPASAVAVREKMKTTNLTRHGVDNIFKSEKFKANLREANLERYGVPYALQATPVRDKAKSTMTSRYGAGYTLESAVLLDKVRATNLSRYGTENPIQNAKVRQKASRTMLERYGVEHAAGSSALMFSRKKVVDRFGTTHFVRGYEDKAVNYFSSAQSVLAIKSQGLPCIRYCHNGQKHTYYPDLLVKTATKKLLIEVKSAYTLYSNLQVNLRKFRRAAEEAAKRDCEFWVVLFHRGKMLKARSPTCLGDLYHAGFPRKTKPRKGGK